MGTFANGHAENMLKRATPPSFHNVRSNSENFPKPCTSTDAHAHKGETLLIYRNDSSWKKPGWAGPFRSQ